MRSLENSRTSNVRNGSKPDTTAIPERGGKRTFERGVFAAPNLMLEGRAGAFPKHICGNQEYQRREDGREMAAPDRRFAARPGKLPVMPPTMNTAASTQSTSPDKA